MTRISGHAFDEAEARLVAGRPEEEARARIATHVRAILTELGLDLTDANLQRTHERVAEMYLEMFHGLREGAEPEVTTFPNDEGYSHMVMEKEIPFYSMCSHHLVPFYGRGAHRLHPARADHRPVQVRAHSRVLRQAATATRAPDRAGRRLPGGEARPAGAMVVIEARHLCVEMRGVKKPGALTVTSAIRGTFHERPVREEFLDLLRRD